MSNNINPPHVLIFQFLFKKKVGIPKLKAIAQNLDAVFHINEIQNQDMYLHSLVNYISENNLETNFHQIMIEQTSLGLTEAWEQFCQISDKDHFFQFNNIDKVNYESYRFGIITAIQEEYEAVCSFLNNIKSIPKPDSNQLYTIGEIPSCDNGIHSVVVIKTGKGNYVATHRVTSLLMNFKSIKEIIMTGIGGGIPNPSKLEDHVRLGDIVILNDEGIIPFEFSTQSKEINVLDQSSPPPSRFLLGVVDNLENSSRDLFLDKIIDKNGNSRIHCPNNNQDVLRDSYSPEVIIEHPIDNSRKKNQPKMHLGRIACTNRVLKDPHIRDQLRDKNAKAVEMEGFGLAIGTSDFRIGYLIVRGISDYCDKYKNDIWKRYAAHIAAAYTITIIESIPFFLK